MGELYGARVGDACVGELEGMEDGEDRVVLMILCVRMQPNSTSLHTWGPQISIAHL